MSKVSIFWFRRDLRLHDNAGLYHALKSGNPVLPIFIFDKNILDKLEDKKDRRVVFIHNILSEIQNELNQFGASLLVKYGTPEEIFPALLNENDVEIALLRGEFKVLSWSHTMAMAMMWVKRFGYKGGKEIEENKK